MTKVFSIFAALLIIIFFVGCNRKSHPAAVKTPAPSETKVVKKRPVVTAVPKVIIVNDKVAKRSIDGRYYYDLNGHRYWRNNKDGKYYIFNKSMFDNPDFKSPDSH